MKRDRARAFLTEFIIVIIFFSLAAIVTVRLFALASAKSSDTNRLNYADNVIKQEAEGFLACETADDALLTAGISYYDDSYVITEKETDFYAKKVVTSTDTDNGVLVSSAISIYDGDDVVTTVTVSKYFSNGGVD